MTTWLVDSHLHFYPCYQIDKWLDSIFNNFQSYVNRRLVNSTSNQIKFACFLTERLSENFFEFFRSSDSLENYKITSIVTNYESIVITSPSGQSITIYRGQQLIALEGIEVLALGKKVFDKNPKLPALEIISSINENGAIAVIPWSFGKWHGKRLGTVINCLNDVSCRFFLGDIFGRDNFCGGNFAKIKTQFNREVLCGSDPLPMKKEEKLAACKVSVITDDTKDEFEDILTALSNYNLSTTRLNCAHLIEPKFTTSLFRQLRLRMN